MHLNVCIFETLWQDPSRFMPEHAPHYYFTLIILFQCFGSIGPLVGAGVVLCAKTKKYVECSKFIVGFVDGLEAGEIQEKVFILMWTNSIIAECVVTDAFISHWAQFSEHLLMSLYLPWCALHYSMVIWLRLREATRCDGHTYHTPIEHSSHACVTFIGRVVCWPYGLEMPSSLTLFPSSSSSPVHNFILRSQ